MKTKRNIVVVIATGLNGIMVKGGCRLHSENSAYNEYFQELIKYYPIVITKGVYDSLSLPEKSPPFPCHAVYIVDPAISFEIPRHTRNVIIALSFDQAFKLSGDARKIIVLVDTIDIFNSILREYNNEICKLVHVTFNGEIIGKELLHASAFIDWFPTMKVGKHFKEHSSPSAFTIVERRYNPLFH